MKKQIFTAGIVGGIIGLIVGLSIGLYQKNEYVNSHLHETEMEHADDGHMHALYEVPVDQKVPRVRLVLHEDTKSGWNVQILTENFEFVPDHVGMDHVMGEGHAHIYVDGVKINRVYGEWYYLGDLSDGTHTIEVRLSTNDHQEYAIDGQAIGDVETLLVAPNDTMMEM